VERILELISEVTSELQPYIQMSYVIR